MRPQKPVRMGPVRGGWRGGRCSRRSGDNRRNQHSWAGTAAGRAGWQPGWQRYAGWGGWPLPRGWMATTSPDRATVAASTSHPGPQAGAQRHRATPLARAGRVGMRRTSSSVKSGLGISGGRKMPENFRASSHPQARRGAFSAVSGFALIFKRFGDNINGHLLFFWMVTGGLASVGEQARVCRPSALSSCMKVRGRGGRRRSAPGCAGSPYPCAQGRIQPAARWPWTALPDALPATAIGRVWPSRASARASRLARVSMVRPVLPSRSSGANRVVALPEGGGKSPRITLASEASLTTRCSLTPAGWPSACPGPPPARRTPGAARPVPASGCRDADQLAQLRQRWPWRPESIAAVAAPPPGRVAQWGQQCQTATQAALRPLPAAGPRRGSSVSASTTAGAEGGGRRCLRAGGRVAAGCALDGCGGRRSDAGAASVAGWHWQRGGARYRGCLQALRLAVWWGGRRRCRVAARLAMLGPAVRRMRRMTRMPGQQASCRSVHGCRSRHPAAPARPVLPRQAWPKREGTAASASGPKHLSAALSTTARFDARLAVCPGPSRARPHSRLMRRGTPRVMAMDAGHGPRIEGQRRCGPPPRAGGRCSGGFRPRSVRVEVVAGNHALRQLFQLGALEHGAQPGLADQHDL